MQNILKEHKTTLLWLGLVAIVSLLPVLVLLKNGFFISDDGEWMVIRFTAFYQTLRDGQIPPRFFGRLNHGYGYPIGTFLYPGFLYLATAFKVIGLSFTSSIKAVFIISFLFSGVGSFLWLRARFSDTSAFLGALVYTYFPYHLYDLYVRGSIGELLAFAVLPWLLVAIDRKNLLVSSLLFGFLIISHNTFALLLVPFLLFYTYLCGKRELFLLFPLGLLASLFFWLPSLIELPLTVFSQIAISDWQAYFVTQSNLSLLSGIGLALFILSLFILYRKKQTTTLFFVGMYLFGLFFASTLSTLLWQLLLLPKLVQFPWRFLILTTWAGSFLTAYLIDAYKGKTKKILIALFLVLLFVSGREQFTAYRFVMRDEGYYSTNEDTTTTKGEYMPKTVTKIPTMHQAELIEYIEGRGHVTLQSQTSSAFQFTSESPTGAQLLIHKIFYPGWVATRDGKATELTPSKEGYLMMTVPQGTTTVALRFQETPLRLFADIVSVLTTLGLLMLLLVRIVIPQTSRPGWYNKYL